VDAPSDLLFLRNHLRALELAAGDLAPCRATRAALARISRLDPARPES